MKRLFIIGASVLQLPAILRAKELGYYVGVADYNPNAVGIRYADEYYNVSTIDEEGVYQAAKDFKADGIMTLATDMPMRSVAYACSKLGLTGISYDTAVKATDKGEMIKAFEKCGVEHPWYFIVRDSADLEAVKDQITYPCISKPVDNSGSRGVMLVNSANELEKSVRYSSENGRKGGVIIEEYLTGREVSVEVMAIAGEAHVLQVTDKLTTGAPHFVETGHTQPGRLPEKDIEAIKDLARRAVRSVGIENGPAHVEIMNTAKGPRMIELGARMGGDCITTHLVPLSTGIDMVEATMRIALGETPDIERKYNKGSAIRYLDVPPGVIERIEGAQEARKAKGVAEVTFTKGAADKVDAVGSSSDRVGFVIAQGKDALDAQKNCEAAMAKIRVVMREDDETV